MKTVIVNLYTLIQCPAVWFWHILGGILSLILILRPVIHPAEGEGIYCGYLLTPIWAALITASLAKETMVKSFAFCLPGHSHVVRRHLLLVGGVLSLLLSLTFLTYPNLAAMEKLSALVSAASLGMVAYIFIVLWAFLLRNVSGMWGLIFFFIWSMETYFKKSRVVTEQWILEQPLVNALFAGLFVVLLWLKLERRSLARALCGSAFLSLQSTWNKRKLDRFSLDMKNKKRAKRRCSFMRRNDAYYLARMMRQPFLSLKRYLWGIRYTVSGATAPGSPWDIVFLFFFVLIALILTGYLVPSEKRADVAVSNFLFLAPCSIGCMLPFPLYSTLLLPAGRRERYWANLHLAVKGGFAALLVSVILFLVSHALAAVAPEIPWFGEIQHYRPMDPELICFALIPLPILYCFRILFPKRMHIAQVIFLIITALIYCINTDLFIRMWPVGTAVLCCITWLIFWATLRHYARSVDLVVP